MVQRVLRLLPPTARMKFLGWLLPAAILVAALVAVTVTVLLVAPGLVGIVGVLCVGAVWQVWPRKGDLAPQAAANRIALPEALGPWVLADVSAAADAVGTGMPIEVFVTLEGSCRVVPSPARGAAQLEVGIGQLVLLGAADRRALVARELLRACACPGLDGARLRSAARLAHGVERLRFGGTIFRPLGVRVGARLSKLVDAEWQRASDEQDARAAETLGGDVFATALRADLAASAIFWHFWDSELQSVLRAGFQPPLVDGLLEYVARWSERDDPEALVGRILADDAQALLRVRFARLPQPGQVTLGDGPVAAERAGLEQAAIALVTSAAAASSLAVVPATWSEAIGAAAMRSWRESAALQHDWLDGLALEDVPATLRALHNSDDGHPLFEDVRVAGLASLLALSLVEAGWRIETGPGAPIAFAREGVQTLPFALCASLADRSASDEDFADWCGRCELEQFAPLEALLEHHELPSPGPVPASLAALAAAPVADTPHLPGAELVGALTVPLAQHAGTRLIAFLGILLAGVFGLSTAIYATLYAFTADVAQGEEILLLVIAALAAAFFVYVVWLARWDLVGRPVMRIEPTGTITVEHPALLCEPLSIPREALRAADVDVSEDGGRFAILDPRAPLTPDGRQTVGWLWRSDRGSALPTLDRRPGHPNIAILLSQTLQAPRPRGQALHSVLKGERLGGMLLCAADPAAARSALDALGILRPLTVEDLEPAPAQVQTT